MGDTGVETVFRDDVLHVGSIGPFFFQRWMGTAGAEHVHRMLDAHRAFVREFPARSTIALSHIATQRFSPPDDASRGPMKEHAKLLSTEVRAVTTVIDADGFVAGMVRSIVSGLMLVADRTLEHKVCRSLEDGFAYLAPFAPKGSVACDPSRLLAAYRAAH
jgi:hypothetical protein